MHNHLPCVPSGPADNCRQLVAALLKTSVCSTPVCLALYGLVITWMRTRSRSPWNPAHLNICSGIPLCLAFVLGLTWKERKKEKAWPYLDAYKKPVPLGPLTNFLPVEVR